MPTVKASDGAVRRVPVDVVADRLSRELDRILELLADDPRVEQVWLTGSVLTGQVHATSDLDLTVVLRTKSDPVTRRLELARSLAPAVPVDLFVFTPAEFAAGSRFVDHVRRRGRRLR